MGKEIPLNIPLTGRCNNSDPPASIGTNFRTLKNLRYTSNGLRGVSGMTKINTTALVDYLKIRNAFHFKKEQPSESHVVAQAYNAGLTASQVLVNNSVIPAQADFSGTALWTDSAGASRGRFSDAPNGDMIYCNGVDTCVWGGDEARIGGFLNYDPDDTFLYDYTDKLRTTLSSDAVTLVPKSVAAGIDSYVSAMLHCNGTGTTFTDSSLTPCTFTAQGNAQLSTTNPKFGTACGLLDGTGDYLTTPDDDRFDFSGGKFTLDTWVYITNSIPAQPLFYQSTDADNYILCQIEGRTVSLKIVAASATVVYIVTAVGTVPTNAWAHIEIAEDGNSWYIFINGVLKATETDTSRAVNYTGQVQIGYSTGTAYFSGKFDEYRISKGIARHTANFEPPTQAYSSSASGNCYFYIGATRPLKGVKFYIGNFNTSAGSMSCDYWDGTSWVAVSNLVDGTSTGTPAKSLAQNGSVTFTSTESVAKVKIINGVMLYWYRFVVSELDSTTTLNYVTLDMPFQTIKDLWDGSYREIASAMFYRSAKKVYKDFSVCVAKDTYESSNNATFAKLNGILAADAQYFGFIEPMCGLSLNFAEEYTNETENCTSTVEYWNGSAWVVVPGLNDGTLNEGITYGKSGIISWSPIASTVENKRSLGNNENLMYFYKVTFSKASTQTDANSIRLYYAAGIPSPKTITGYKFPLFAEDRVWLCSETAGDKNSAICLMKDTSSVINGEDSKKIYFGDESEITAATSFFARVGDEVYNVKLFFKKKEVWTITGNTPEKFVKRQISQKYGCVAPLTVVSANAVVGDTPKLIIIWQGSDGIYMFDQNSIIPVHNDIRSFFDKNSSTKLYSAKIADSVGFFDPEKNEYHWLFATGSSTTLNNEWVLDLYRMKWFEISRGSGKALQCGCPVEDTYGNQYAYGFIDTGYMERLEYGTTFDGSDIVFDMHFGDFPLMDSIMYRTKIIRAKLITVAKATTTATASIEHYGDGCTTVSQTAFTNTTKVSGYNSIMPIKKFNNHEYTLHSLRYTITTNDETFGFEPVMVGVLGEAIREDLEA